jgi:hypothetical protein
MPAAKEVLTYADTQVVGRWNKAGLNRLTRHIAPWMPGFGVIVHRGRRSGRRFQTPVNVFSAGNAMPSL